MMEYFSTSHNQSGKCKLGAPQNREQNLTSDKNHGQVLPATSDRPFAVPDLGYVPKEYINTTNKTVIRDKTTKRLCSNLPQTCLYVCILILFALQSYTFSHVRNLQRDLDQLRREYIKLSHQKDALFSKKENRDTSFFEKEETNLESFDEQLDQDIDDEDFDDSRWEKDEQIQRVKRQASETPEEKRQRRRQERAQESNPESQGSKKRHNKGRKNNRNGDGKNRDRNRPSTNNRKGAEPKKNYFGFYKGQTNLSHSDGPGGHYVNWNLSAQSDVDENTVFIPLVNGKAKIESSGVYLIYAQITFNDASRDRVGFSIESEQRGVLAKCVQTFPNSALKVQSCYTSVVYALKPDDQIFLSNTRHQSTNETTTFHSLSEMTFWGIVKL